MLFPGHNCCLGLWNHILLYPRITWYCSGQGRCAPKEGGTSNGFITTPHSTGDAQRDFNLIKKLAVSFHHLQQALEWILNELQVVAGWVGIGPGNWTHRPITFHCCWGFKLAGKYTWDIYRTSKVKCREVQCNGCKGFTNTSVKKPLKVTEIKRQKNQIDEARIG